MDVGPLVDAGNRTSDGLDQAHVCLRAFPGFGLSCEGDCSGPLWSRSSQLERLTLASLETRVGDTCSVLSLATTTARSRRAHITIASGKSRSLQWRQAQLRCEAHLQFQALQSKQIALQDLPARTVALVLQGVDEIKPDR